MVKSLLDLSGKKEITKTFEKFRRDYLKSITVYDIHRYWNTI